jgi:predicted metal-dependent phosphoesterase TrpH
LAQISSGGIDLHAHTTASDGSLSPTELITLAVATGLSAIAVTDHDTIGGLAEAAEAAVAENIELIPGVELSVEDDRGRFHLLGYLFYPDDQNMAETLASLRVSRAKRNVEMADKMKELGLPVTMDDVISEAGPDSQVIARPHFAKALMKAGIVSSVQEAFDRYLASGKPLYQPKQVLTPHDAIAMIHKAGGIAVMAHPGLVPLDEQKLAERVALLTSEDKMDGIEAHYSQHSPEQTRRFLQLARDNDLIVTAGSDFHGTPKPHVTLGVIENGTAAPVSILDAMRLRAAEIAGE